MFRYVVFLLLWGYATLARGGLVKQATRLEDIIGLFVCGGTNDSYNTHTTTLSEFEIENFSHKVSNQLWFESGTRCQFKNGETMGKITWATSTTGDEVCSTSVERGYLNGGIQRYLRAHPTWRGRQCLIILHGQWKGYVSFSTENGTHSATDHDCTGFLSSKCILSGSHDCQGLFC